MPNLPEFTFIGTYLLLGSKPRRALKKLGTEKLGTGPRFCDFHLMFFKRDNGAGRILAIRHTSAENRRNAGLSPIFSAEAFYELVSIHEMIHHAGYAWGDDFLARVLHEMGEADTLPTSELGNTASDILHAAVVKHCGSY